MERELLRVLDFDLTQPTIKTFLRRYIKAASGAWHDRWKWLPAPHLPSAFLAAPTTSTLSCLPACMLQACCLTSRPPPTCRRDPPGRDL